MSPYIKMLTDRVEGDIIYQLSSQSLNERLQRALRNKGLPAINFHKLRHISASTMAALNIPTNYVQEKGGWKTDYTMQTVYTHTFTEERKKADQKMDDFFNKIITNANGSIWLLRHHRYRATLMGSSPLRVTIRRHSSVGRAPAPHAGGHRFESCCLHQEKPLEPQWF